jgi:hypothetical protein
MTQEDLVRERFMASVRRGLEQAERGEGISHAEVKRRLRELWRTGRRISDPRPHDGSGQSDPNP